MKSELLQRVMATLDAFVLQTLGHAAVGITDLSDTTKKRFQKREWNNSPTRKRLEKMIRKMPDTDAEKFVSSSESWPAEMRKLLKDAVASMPKNRGGRTPQFTLEVRRQAIQDMGKEIARGHSPAEAREIVAKQYGMATAHLRGVWKNRKRLMRN